MHPDADLPVCASNHHDSPVVAVVSGVFETVGRPAHEIAYCLRCAAVVELGGMFTPDRALGPFPDLVAEYADRIDGTWSVAEQEATLMAAAPDTVALLRAYPGPR